MLMMNFLPLSDDYQKTYWSQRQANAIDSNTVDSVKFQDIDELREHSYRMGATSPPEFVGIVTAKMVLDILPPQIQDLQSDALKQTATQQSLLTLLNNRQPKIEFLDSHQTLKARSDQKRATFVGLTSDDPTPSSNRFQPINLQKVIFSTKLLDKVRSFSIRNDGHWNSQNVAVQTLCRRLARMTAVRYKSSFDQIAASQSHQSQRKLINQRTQQGQTKQHLRQI